MDLSGKDIRKAINVLIEFRSAKQVELQSARHLSSMMMYNKYDQLSLDYQSIDRTISLLKKYQFEHIYDGEKAIKELKELKDLKELTQENEK